MDVRGRGSLEERSGTADAGREAWASSGGKRDRGEVSNGPQELASATPLSLLNLPPRRSARLFDLQAVAQLGAQDLPHRVAGELLHEHELTGPLIWREMGAAVRDQIGFADVAGGDDEGRDLLTLARCGEARRARARATRRRAAPARSGCSRSSPPTRSPRSASPTNCHGSRPGSRRAPPRLGDAALRPFLAAPGPRVGAARDALPHLARRCDVLVVAATTALYRLAPPRLSRRVHVLPEAGHAARRRRAARAARARRLPARHAGRLARRVQLARRADRPLPDGQRAAVPPRSLRRRHREHQDLRRRHAAHALSGARRAPAARARVPARRSGPHALPQPLSARSSKAIRRARRSTRT